MARRITIGGLAATFTLFLLAIILFPGGQAEIQKYSFTRDYLSALGMTRTSSGADNTISSLFFNGALLMDGVVLVCFWNKRATFIAQPLMAIFLRICGIITAMGIIGIGLTPYNLFSQIHNQLDKTVALFCCICFVVCICCTDSRFEGWRSRLGWLFTFVLSGLGELLVLYRRPNGLSPVIMQKLFVTLFMLWVGWQGFLFGRKISSRQDQIRFNATHRRSEIGNAH